MNRPLIIGIGAVVLLVIAGVVAWRNLAPPAIVTDAVHMVCVETGERFELAPGDIDYLPAANPDNGHRTLVPCVERDGAWYVPERRRDLLEQLRAQNKFVDEKTLEVKRAN